MMNRGMFVFAWLFTLCFMVILPVQAEQPRELLWDDLIPKSADFHDPFTTLIPEQLYLLATVAQFRARQDEGSAIDDKEVAEAENAYIDLKAKGVDVDGLLAQRDEIAEKRRQRATATNGELDGKLVRMPGYVLPLEFTDKKVTEFLLVPYVGACIHTPPPPPNQIILVKIHDGFESAGMFTPVWVNGVLRSQQGNPSLSLVDGSADIPVAYVLTADDVEPYE